MGRKKEHGDLATQYRSQYESQKSSSDALKKEFERNWAIKLKKPKDKREFWWPERKRAEAQESIQNTMSSMNNKSAFDTFDRMSQKVDDMEANAAAQVELNEALKWR